MADVLRAAGGFAPADVHVILDGDADDLQTVLGSLEGRTIGILLFYYSGHSDGFRLELGEVSQESGRLGGGFFTHHLVSGLWGAADADDDRVVTLLEAYDHAFARTLADTVESSTGTQHPSYSFRLKGRGGSLPMTTLREGAAILGFPAGLEGVFFVIDDDTDGVVAEVNNPTRDTHLFLPPGTPLFALAGAAEYQNRFQSLKAEPLAVMVASINGDAVVSGEDAASLISEVCLADTDLDRCQDYQATQIAPETDPACGADPTTPGCEDLLLAKQECVRQCYVASKGDNTNPQAKNSYICAGAVGTADWGGRYARMAYMFGVNGLNLNLCSPDGFGPVMQQLGEFVAGAME